MNHSALALLTKAILAGLLWSAAAVAAPPPPLPPGATDFGKELPRVYRDNDIDHYLRLFSADVVLVKDGKEVGRGIAALRSDYASEKAMGLRMAAVAVASGGNEVLVMQKVTNIPEVFDTGVHDCCFWFRAIRYRIGTGDKVDRIDMLTAQSTAWLQLMQPDF